MDGHNNSDDNIINVIFVTVERGGRRERERERERKRERERERERESGLSYF